MSISFDISKWRSTESFTFPVPVGSAPQDLEAVPWVELRENLKARGARENPDADRLWLDLADDGALQIRGMRDDRGTGDYVLIAFKVRCYWTDVLEIFRKALDIDPNLVLFDSQDGVYHNATTFEPIAIAQRAFQREGL